MTDLFDQNSQPTPVANTNVSSDPLADKLKEIVNEQGQPKYKDSNAAWEALKASQDHIKRLEDEAKASQAEIVKAREEKVRADALEAIVNRMSNNSSAPTRVETPTNSGTSEEATIKLLERVLEQRDVQAVAKRNASSVNDALLAKFGDKAKEVVATKAKELGMTPQELGEFSSRSPQMVLQVFGLTGSIPNPSQPTVPSPSPLNPPRPDTGIKMPERSLLSGLGATESAQASFMNEIKERVHKRLNIES